MWEGQLHTGDVTWLEKPQAPLTRSPALAPAQPEAHPCLWICCWIQGTCFWTFVKTAGRSTLEQPMLQLTTPTWIQVPLVLHIRGPPESPCGEGTVTEHVGGQGAQPQQARARRRPRGRTGLSVSPCRGPGPGSQHTACPLG